MKKPKYRVRVEEGAVIVEHRASFSPGTLSVFILFYLSYGLFSDIRKALVEFYTSPDASTGALACLLLLVPLLSSLSWLRFASGEVLFCDRNEVRFAQRRMWGRWHRFRFPSGDVKKLRRALRGGNKSRSYSVLTFDVQGQTYDILEELGYTDSDRVLRACKAMGVDVFIDETSDAMMKDIEKRGWWINPFRTDDLGGSSDSSAK